MNKQLKIIQYLSLDVVLGSLAVGYLAVRLLDVIPNPYWWPILALSVWIIYSFDHLLDGYKHKNNGKIERHNYYFRNRKIIIPIMGLFSLIVVILSFLYLDKGIITGGILLGIITLLYFLTINFSSVNIRYFIPKELIISIIYTTGIVMAPIIWKGELPEPSVILIIIIIGLLAFSEGVMISYFDYELDLADGHSSFTIRFGQTQTKRFLLALHLIVEIAIIIALFKAETRFILICLILLLLINFILGLLTMIPHRPFVLKYHKIIGEAVFILPFILTLF